MPARLEHAFADRGGANDASFLGIAKCVFLFAQCGEMCNGVEPFVVPGEDSGPHLVALIGFDFAFEATIDSAEPDGEAAFLQLVKAAPVARVVDADGEERA